MIVSHVENPEAANKIIEAIKKKFKINKCLMTLAAPVVGTHTGWGTVIVCLLPSIEKAHVR
ncbi:MAG: DegV family protein [Candidatus Heimdallarchaeota archaeon]|nr:DegV family protein [Candidatus Heimdallarchaeota archaeon]